MNDDKKTEGKSEEKRVRCRCGHKFHRPFGFYPDTRLMDLPGLRAKLGRPIEPADLDKLVMCRTCADVRRNLQLPPEEAYKAKAYDFVSTGKRVAEFEEEFSSAVVCSECNQRVAEKKAFVPGFGAMRQILGRVARLADLPKVQVCAKCLGKKDRGLANTYYPLAATRAQMEKDAEKRRAEAHARSERAVREQLGLAPQEAPPAHNEPALRATIGDITGLEVRIEHPEDDELAEVLQMGPPAPLVEKKSRRGERRAEGKVKADKKAKKGRKRAANADADE